MYTAPAARGRGVARAVLAAVERSAREQGRKRVVLECGDKQPEAIAMYTLGRVRADPELRLLPGRAGLRLLRPHPLTCNRRRLRA